MSEILDNANEMARDLFKVGAMDEITMRKIDALCLPTKRTFQPEDIRRIRSANHVISLQTNVTDKMMDDCRVIGSS